MNRQKQGPDRHVFRPHRVTRVANTAPRLLLMWFSLDALNQPQGLPVVLSGLGFVIGLYAAIRAPFMGVEIDGKNLRVRGQLWDRTIPRNSVIALRGGFIASITRKNNSGSRRWIPVFGLSTPPRSLGAFASHNSHTLQELRRSLRTDK